MPALCLILLIWCYKTYTAIIRQTPRKHCTQHMEVMQARLTVLEPNDRPLTTLALLVVNSVK